MKRFVQFLCLTVALVVQQLNAAPEDPYLWLEDVEGETSLDWVRQANDKCLEALGNPKGTESYERILKVLESKDRIPHVTQHLVIRGSFGPRGGKPG